VPEVLSPNEVTARQPNNRAKERNYRKGAKAVIAPKKGKGDADTKHHARNFLDCVRSRQRCNCDVEIGHRETTAALIGNIALKTKSHLEWDGKSERFTNNEAANKLLSYAYRRPYRLP
jgi:hypothetical protein